MDSLTPKRSLIISLVFGTIGQTLESLTRFHNLTTLFFIIYTFFLYLSLFLLMYNNIPKVPRKTQNLRIREVKNVLVPKVFGGLPSNSYLWDLKPKENHWYDFLFFEADPEYQRRQSERNFQEKMERERRWKERYGGWDLIPEWVF